MRFWESVIGVAVITASSCANAALIERLGGLAYYDDVADLTWLADASAGAGSIFDNGNNTSDGAMTWENANAWAADLNVAGVTGWRLPVTLQPDASCSSQNIYSSYGYNCTGSELGNLFYNVLGGSAGVSIRTTHNANYDLFSNIRYDQYWSATLHKDSTAYAWYFNVYRGNQDVRYINDGAIAWAVQSGDVGAVPVPATVWLFISGLIGLVGFARRKKA